MTDQILFSCTTCGSKEFAGQSDPPKDDDVISCAGCGREIGTYAVIREAMIEEGKKVLNKMIDDANLPPWITRK